MIMKTFIFILATIFMLQYFHNGKTIEVGEIKHNNVILYATDWCGYCEKTRQFLDENHIPYTEYDIEKSEQGRKQHAALNAKGVPVLDIKGTIIYGYDMKNTRHVLSALNLM
jgi:mycoredoxin